jgi:DNA-directed RNA polymerase specialized sigma24 family protein
MRPEASVTQWLDRLKAGDPDAAQKLWERYFGRLVGLARKKLRAVPRRAADEEDVALSMEGYGNEEIAARLGYGLRTVERRLRLIRSIWEQEGAS